jgi:hypothetical protein
MLQLEHRRIRLGRVGKINERDDTIYLKETIKKFFSNQELRSMKEVINFSVGIRNVARCPR